MATPSPPTQKPTPQQIAAMQQQLAAEAQKKGMTPQEFANWQRQQLTADAAKHGLSVEQYVEKLKAQALQQHQQKLAQQQQQQQQQQHQSHQSEQQHAVQQEQGQANQQAPINPAAPDRSAVALAKWLRGQDLKSRTCILNGQRKDMFKVKRALRALQSPAYQKASSKASSLLPSVTSASAAVETFKLLPLSLLALRVSKIDPHEGHAHAKPQKRIKGVWTVRIEQQQEIRDGLHYVWLYEGPQWRQKVYAGGALAAIMAVVMFPLWPVKLRLGVWYLSMGMLGLIGLFFVMAIFRLILFCATMFTVPPGLWLYPNLFEDVGFFDSFRPVWGWQEEKKKKTKRAKKGRGDAAANEQVNSSTSNDNNAEPMSSAPVATGISLATNTTGSDAAVSHTKRRDLTTRIEEVEED